MQFVPVVWFCSNQGTVTATNIWVVKWLPREVVDGPFLETFQARRNGAMSNLMWLKMFLLIAGGVGLVEL